MTPLLPAVCGALVVAGVIGMVYALRPAQPKPPRPARTVTPFGRLGQPASPGSARAPERWSSAVLLPAWWSRW